MAMSSKVADVLETLVDRADWRGDEGARDEALSVIEGIREGEPATSGGPETPETPGAEQPGEGEVEPGAVEPGSVKPDTGAGKKRHGR